MPPAGAEPSSATTAVCGVEEVAPPPRKRHLLTLLPRFSRGSSYWPLAVSTRTWTRRYPAMPPRGGSPARYALMKNCTFPFTAGKCRNGCSWYATQPSAALGWRSPPVVRRGTERMKTSAPRTARPRWSVTLMRAVIGLTRLRTGFGENRTCETTRRSPPALSDSTETELPVGGGVPPPTAPVWFDSADREPTSFRAVTRTRSVRPVSLSTTRYWLSVAPLISLQLSPAALQR